MELFEVLSSCDSWDWCCCRAVVSEELSMEVREDVLRMFPCPTTLIGAETVIDVIG